MTVTRTDRLVAPLDQGGLEIVGYEVLLPDGYEIQSHVHAYPTIVRVLDGALTYQVGDAPAKDYGAGDVFSEPAGVAVRGRAVKPTTLYVVLVRRPGEPEAKLTEAPVVR
jgi:quercetin dioxygenase-like cupin family protein